MTESWEMLAPGYAVFYWPVCEDEKRFDIIRKEVGAYYQPVCSSVSGEDRANLIAAAPEMLAALTAQDRADKAWAEYKQWALGTNWAAKAYNKWSMYQADAVRQRQAAIAKARGV